MWKTYQIHIGNRGGVNPKFGTRINGNDSDDSYDRRWN